MSNVLLHKNALAYALPPIAEFIPQGKGSAKEFEPFDIQSDNEEIILTALYPEKDYILARFCNYSDEKSSAKFTCSRGVVTAETDLLGENTKNIENNTLNFHPWEIKTVKIVL